MFQFTTIFGEFVQVEYNSNVVTKWIDGEVRSTYPVKNINQARNMAIHICEKY